MISKNAQKLTGICLVMVLVVAGICCFNRPPAKPTDAHTIDKLTIYFVPSKDPDTIVSVTKPLKEALKKQMAQSGYTVNDVDIRVGTSNEAVGEALSSGAADVGFIPGGTYTMFDDGADVLLTATRQAINKTSVDPKDWNNGEPTANVDAQADSYCSIIVTGPSPKGRELARKVNAGQKLTWDDLNSARWGTSSTISSSGYMYPSEWLQENYNHTIGDLKNTVKIDSTGSGFARLASGQIDVMPMHGDARLFAGAKLWQKNFHRSKTIWQETNVIGVTQTIRNDTVCVSKKSKNMTPEARQALAKAMMDIAKTKEGHKAISVYSHDGYVLAKPEDYDRERRVQAKIKESMN